MLERWKKAVVHLEGATDSVSMNESIQRIEELHKLHKTGQVSPEDLLEELDRGHRDLRYQGTAVFLEHEERRYLITARHVLHDRKAHDKKSKKRNKRQAKAGRTMLQPTLWK